MAHFGATPVRTTVDVGNIRAESGRSEDEDEVYRVIAGFRANSTTSQSGSPTVQRTLFPRNEGEPTRPSSLRGRPAGGSSSPAAPYASPSFGKRMVPPSPAPPPPSSSFSSSSPGANTGEPVAAFNSVVQFWKEAESRATAEDVNRLRVELESARQQAQVRARPAALITSSFSGLRPLHPRSAVTACNLG